MARCDRTDRSLPPGRGQSCFDGGAVARALVATLACLVAALGCQCQLIGAAVATATASPDDRCRAGSGAASGSAGPLIVFGDDARGPLSSSGPCPAGGDGAADIDKAVVATPATTHGIFWSEAVERLLPPPADRSHRQRHWHRHARSQAVSAVRVRCGRLRGAYTVTFEDGRTSVCARPQYDVDHLLGTVYAGALAGLLGLGSHVPAMVLVPPPEREPERWSAVADDIRAWRLGRPVAFVDLADASRLADAVLPEPLAAALLTSGSPLSERRPSLTPAAVGQLSAAEAAVLAQWSDLVLFDYITAHTDRIVNGIVSARWSSGGARDRKLPVHKMAADLVDGSLLYTDNEDALFQGFSLLDSVADDGRPYAAYHEAFLSQLCVFRASTVGAIERYHRSGDLADELVKAVERHDAVAERFLPHLGMHMGSVLQARLANVASWVQNCSVTYSGRGAGHPGEGPYRA